VKVKKPEGTLKQRLLEAIDDRDRWQSKAVGLLQALEMITSDFESAPRVMRFSSYTRAKSAMIIAKGKVKL
jgi:hypothetical protein